MKPFVSLLGRCSCTQLKNTICTDTRPQDKYCTCAPRVNDSAVETFGEGVRTSTSSGKEIACLPKRKLEEYDPRLHTRLGRCMLGGVFNSAPN